MKTKSLKQKAESRKLVKITSAGKISVSVEKEVKAFLRHVLAESLENIDQGNQLNPATASSRINKALLDELYHKHFSELHAYRHGRILLNRSQAIVFWMYCYSNNWAMRNPQYNFLMMQLHQKLTSI